MRMNSFGPLFLITRPRRVCRSRYNLYQEPKNISVGLSKPNKRNSKMVASRPFGEVSNYLTVQTDCLSADLIQFLFSECNFCNIYCWRENSEFGFLSSHHLHVALSYGCNNGWCYTNSLCCGEARSCLMCEDLI